MRDHRYASDHALVDSDWAQAHLTDPSARFVEVDVDTTSYAQSHLPGAVAWDWRSQLPDGVRRDIATRQEFSALLSASGIGPDTTFRDDILLRLVGVPIEKAEPVAIS